MVVDPLARVLDRLSWAENRCLNFATSGNASIRLSHDINRWKPGKVCLPSGVSAKANKVGKQEIISHRHGVAYQERDARQIVHFP